MAGNFKKTINLFAFSNLEIVLIEENHRIHLKSLINLEIVN